MKFLNDYKLFVQRIGLIGITNILVALSSLILLPILTKNFSISDYGIWVEINTTIALMPSIISLGLPFTMVRFLSAEKDKNKIQEGFYTITIVVFIFNIIVSTLIFVFSKSISYALFDGNIQVVMLLSVIIFFTCINWLFINFFRTFQQMKRYCVFLLIQTYLGFFIVSYLVLTGFGVFIAVSGLLIANIVIFFIMSSFIISDIGFKLPKFKNLREYLSFGLPTIPSNLSYWIVDSSDRYVIGILLGTAFVGYYAPGYLLGSVIILFYAPFSFLLPSVLPNYYDNQDYEKVRIFLKYSLKYFLLIAIPTVFGLSILSKPILIIISTSAIALNGYLVTPFVALSALLFGIYGIASEIIVLKKKTKITGIIWIIAAILNLSLNIILVPYIGIIGAAATTLIAYTLAFGLTIFYSLKFFKFDLNPVFILKSIIASILMSLIIIFINPFGILNVLITILISSVIYSMLLLLFKAIKKEEVYFFKRILNYP